MTKVRKLSDLRGEVPQNEVPFFITAGAAVVLVLWQLLCSLGISKNILPTPFSVLKAIPELFFEEHLMTDIAYSVRLNILGYLEACALAIPLGMSIGMFPLFREMFKKHIDSIRFLPITALTGILTLMAMVADSCILSKDCRAVTKQLGQGTPSWMMQRT